MSESDIRQLTATRAAQISRLEFDAMVESFYADDATLMPSGEATLRGIAAIGDFWRATPDNGLVSLALETREVAVSGDLGFEIGQFNRTLRSRHGPPFQESGKHLVIYRRQPNDEWRATAEIFNTDSHR